MLGKPLRGLTICLQGFADSCTKHSATSNSDGDAFCPSCAGVTDSPEQGTAVGAWLSSRAEFASSCDVFGVGTRRDFSEPRVQIRWRIGNGVQNNHQLVGMHQMFVVVVVFVVRINVVLSLRIYDRVDLRLPSCYPTPYRLVKSQRIFGAVCCVHLHGTSSLVLNKSTRRHVTEEIYIYIQIK